MKSDAEPKSERLFSLDLLRGLDMFLLTVVGPFMYALNATVKLPAGVMAQFDHAWGGFSLWDVIMPLFIFMCGAAVPFALEKRLKDGRATAGYWKHVLVRFAMLWVLGGIAQGRFLSLDAQLVNPFNNTLQTIAVGYLIAACVLLVPSRKVQIAIPFVLAAAYAVVLHWFGDYTKLGNAATRFEYWFLAQITPAGSRAVELADPGYSWWLTIPMFGAMTLCGMEATKILTADEDKAKRFRKLAAVGAALLAGGWIAEPAIPCIKHVYTLSFTAQAMGWCCLALAVLFYLTDIRKFRRGLGLFILFGQTALLAYMLVEVFGGVLGAFAKAATAGVPHLLGASALPLAKWLVSSALLCVVLYYRRAAKFRA